VQFVAGSNMMAENIAVYPWVGTPSNPSIGIVTQGHEDSSFRNLAISADLPISIENDPFMSMHYYADGTTSSMKLDADHFHFQDLYLIANNQPCISIADGVILSNVTFDGLQAWVKGTYGLYWNDTTTKSVGYSLAIHNARWEQGQLIPGKNSYGYMVYIHHNYVLQNLVLDNLYTGTNAGISLYKVNYVSLKNVMYAGTATALDLSNVDNISFNASFFQTGSSINIAPTVTGMSGTYEHGTKYFSFMPNTNAQKAP